MYDKRQGNFAREFDLRGKRAHLPFFIERLIMIVEPDFPHRNAFFVRAKLFQRGKIFLRRFAFGVGVNARGEIHLVESFCKLLCGVSRCHVVPRANQSVPPRFTRFCDDVRFILILFVV